MRGFIKQRLGDWGWLAVVTVPTAILYFSNITRWSIWHDESFTAMLINYDWGDILRRTALDVHPPLYYLILKGWSTIFGTSLLAMRSFSALAMLGVIVAAYWLVKSLFGKGAARLATVFLALAPYMLRYAQEARMYALVALLLILATYVLVTAVKKSSAKLLYLYALLVALAIYCHYYAIFLIPAHWLYILLLSWGKNQPPNHISLKNKHWWGANMVIGLLLAPWLPTAYSQFNSIQGAFWILPVRPATFFYTVSHFLLYKDFWHITGGYLIWLSAFTAGLASVLLAAIYLNKFHRKRLLLLVAYACLAPLIIYALSLPPFQPVYNNRYFSLTAVAFYILLAVLVFLRPLNRYRVTQIAAALVIVVTLGFGITNVRAVGNYNPDRNEHYTMKELSEVINRNYHEGDAIVSTNLSTYFDIRYHNQTPATVLLKVTDTPDGIGNTSLIYDRVDILLLDYSAIKTSTNTVWLVTDSKDTNPEVPANWQQLARTEAGYAAIVQYKITGSYGHQVCAQVITEASNIVTGEIRAFPSACLPEGWVPVSN